MKMPVPQQPIDGFDLMLSVHRTAEAAAEVGQRQLAAREHGANDAQQRRRACRVADDEPSGKKTPNPSDSGNRSRTPSSA